ncbi:hypothetical protein SBV1_3080004 [Verrucomicrobia bacterium]|nr:hypothetical protein SBV1_3080004 [Verrucomicrobiota bacterium]
MVRPEPRRQVAAVFPERFSFRSRSMDLEHVNGLRRDGAGSGRGRTLKGVAARSHRAKRPVQTRVRDADATCYTNLPYGNNFDRWSARLYEAAKLNPGRLVGNPDKIGVAVFLPDSARVRDRGHRVGLNWSGEGGLRRRDRV